MIGEREALASEHGEPGRKGRYPHGRKKRRKGKRGSTKKGRMFAQLSKRTSSGRARDGKLTW